MSNNKVWHRAGAWTAGLVACVHGCTMTATIYGQDEIVLAGQIRDFHSSHPDFGRPAGVGEEVTALVDFTLDAGNMAYDGSGELLSRDALDALGREIAPHLFAATSGDTGVFLVKNPFDKSSNGTADTYDPDVGYDPDTANPFPSLDAVPSIPSLTAPTMSVAKVSKITYKGTGPTKAATINGGDYWCDEFFMGQGIDITINGDVNIRVDNLCEIRNGATLIIPDGSTLTFWLGGDFFFENSSVSNFGTHWDHTRLVFNSFGTGDLVFENNTNVLATVVAPDSTVYVQNNSDFYGAITADTVQQDNKSGIHIAGDLVWEGECWSAGDIQGAQSIADTSQIFSAQSFATWFRDAPGVNETDTHQLIMTDLGGGTYTFQTNDWNPIDGELYGNEGDTGNRNFTVALQSIFLNDNCSGAFFEIATSMDAWVFVGETMVIDLGGTTGTNRQRIDLDRLGLSSDRWYQLRVFIAHRTNAPQDLEITTTLPLTPPRDIAFRANQFHD